MFWSNTVSGLLCSLFYPHLFSFPLVTFLPKKKKKETCSPKNDVVGIFESIHAPPPSISTLKGSNGVISSDMQYHTPFNFPWPVLMVSVLSLPQLCLTMCPRVSWHHYSPESTFCFYRCAPGSHTGTFSWQNYIQGSFNCIVLLSFTSSTTYRHVLCSYIIRLFKKPYKLYVYFKHMCLD